MFTYQENEENIIKKLREFAGEADTWFQQHFIRDNYDFFQKFFDTDKLINIEWADIKKLENHVHAFSGNMPHARNKALGEPRLPIEKYRKALLYLKEGGDPIDVVINNLMINGQHNLPGFGRSSISELICYAHPEYVFYNSRDREALKILGLKIPRKRGEKFGQEFRSYNETISPIIAKYKEIVGQRTEFPVSLEVDQFFSWLHKKYQPQTDSIFNEVIDSLQETLDNEESVVRSFHILKDKLGNDGKGDWAWIADSNEVIGTATAHYEIRCEKSKFYIALHFEDAESTSQKLFKDRIGDLPEPLKWVKWFEAQSIEVKDRIPEKDADLVGRLVESLKYLESTVGNKVREIIQVTSRTETAAHQKTSGNLNTILYGPPGTGKTYTTIERALELIGEDDDIIALRSTDRDRRKIIKAQFDKRIDDKRIFFTTFHQSMSYEDFVEGLKPLKPNDEEKFVKYDVLPGIFKQVCIAASSSLTREVDFEEAYKRLLQEIRQSPNNRLLLETLHQKKEFYIYENAKGNLNFHANTDKQTPMVMRKDFIKTYLETGTTPDWVPYVPAVARYLSSKYGSKANDKPYVLIIDEINRGNVSQIFGELITLLEEDKRLGKEEALQAILPYSKESFGVPPNLYIIGTMNTADRSVEALDTALRRRFSFVEIAPDPSKLTNELVDAPQIKLAHLLTKINARLEKLLDRDHLIGHSYFMKVKNLEELRQVFYRNIIPLLQEYFYGDYVKIGYVLGRGFVQKTDNNGTTLADSGYFGNDNLQDRDVYKIIQYNSTVSKGEISDGRTTKKFTFQSAVENLMDLPGSGISPSGSNEQESISFAETAQALENDSQPER